MAECEAKSTDYLLQRLSIAVQRGNCFSAGGHERLILIHYTLTGYIEYSSIL